MTSYLADSHVLLWALGGDSRLPSKYADILNSPAVVFASMASLWEIAIKVSIGKLDAPVDLADFLVRADYRILDVKPQHTEAVRHLPFPQNHRDPFDRLLIAQAQVEELCVMSIDDRFNAYDIKLI